MIRFLEANGYDASYVSGVDIATGAASCSEPQAVHLQRPRRVLVRDPARPTSRRARDAGVNLAFFSGNEVLLEDALGAERGGHGDGRPHAGLLQGHALHSSARTRWSGPARGATRASRPQPETSTPENALTGQSFLVNSGSARDHRARARTATAPVAQHRRERSPPAESLPLAPHTLGYEWDEDPDNGFRPAGQFRLSSTTVSGVEIFTDYGSTTIGGTATHNLTMHNMPSGALVFGAGTVQWSWGLDSANPIGNPPDRNMRQATVNLFADMGAQPYAPIPGLMPATAVDRHHRADRDDHALRRATVDGRQPASPSPARRPTRRRRRRRRRGLDRRRRDLAPGRPGTTSWSYTWNAHGAPTATLAVRAADDSGNIETPGAGRQRQRHLPVLAVGRQRHARAAPTPATPARSSSASSSSPTSTAPSPACASTSPRPTPARTPAACGPRTARGSRRRRSRRDRLRLADRDVRRPGPGAAEHDLRRVLPRPERALLGHASTCAGRPRRARTAAARSTRRRCTRSRTRARRRTASTPTAPPARSRRSRTPRPTTGST